MSGDSPHPAAPADAGPPHGSGAAIADRIASSISMGLLSVGERLPAEVELAQQFGVAVETLRKALAVLRQRGLVVTRRGRSGGTFIVKAPFPTASETRRRLLATSVVELRDLQDEHVAVGRATARLAAQRAWRGSLLRLRELARRLESAERPSDAASADSRFHIELAVLSQSARLLQSEVRLQSEHSVLFWSTTEDLSPISAAHAEHLSIIEALEQRDAESAADAVERHLRHDTSLLIQTLHAAVRAADRGRSTESEEGR